MRLLIHAGIKGAPDSLPSHIYSPPFLVCINQYFSRQAVTTGTYVHCVGETVMENADSHIYALHYDHIIVHNR